MSEIVIFVFILVIVKHSTDVQYNLLYDYQRCFIGWAVYN